MRYLRKILGITLIVVAVMIYCYPTVSSLYNSYLAQQTIAKTTNVEVKGQDLTAEFEKCEIYNKSLNIGTIVVNNKMSQRNTTYESLLNNGNGVMGYIEIPSIFQKLPIYHYTDDKELAKGIGHIAGSSLPIGGENTNCVLTGHRGLPNNLLFTKLDEVNEGDMIYITTLDTIKAYKVYKTKVILPEDTKDITIEEGKDLLTLITCTPYGVNTHRLVLWAERVEFNEDGYKPITTMQAMTKAIPLTRLYVSAIFIVALVIISKVLNRKEGNTDGNL